MCPRRAGDAWEDMLGQGNVGGGDAGEQASSTMPWAPSPVSSAGWNSASKVPFHWPG
jgi:hypothetical protein